jgi:hypothetical protein
MFLIQNSFEDDVTYNGVKQEEQDAAAATTHLAFINLDYRHERRDILMNIFSATRWLGPYSVLRMHRRAYWSWPCGQSVQGLGSGRARRRAVIRRGAVLRGTPGHSWRIRVFIIAHHSSRSYEANGLPCRSSAGSRRRRPVEIQYVCSHSVAAHLHAESIRSGMGRVNDRRSVSGA